MIQLICSQCGQSFDVHEDEAHTAELCPACGTLQDAWLSQSERIDPKISDQLATESRDLQTELPPVGRGIPSTLWWTIATTGVCAFILACAWIMSPTWESNHLLELDATARRGDLLLISGRFRESAQAYQSLLDEVRGRQIQSRYIQLLIDRSHRGLLLAELAITPWNKSATRNSAASAPTTGPFSAPTNSAPTTSPSTTSAPTTSVSPLR